MKRTDLWSGIFWLLISTWVIGESIRFGLGKWSAPGPGFVPFWSGLVLACFSFSLVIRNLLKKSLISEENRFEKIRWGKWGLTLASLLGYALLMESLGFILCTFIFMIVLLAFVEPQRWLLVLLVGMASTIASYLIFQSWLKSQLPKGFLGI